MSCYSPSQYLPVRFFSLAYEGIKTTPTVPHERNLVEKTGDAILYLPENLPRTIKNICTNPQMIAITFFATAHLANSYAFYPDQTGRVVNVIKAYLPVITEEFVRFAAWFSTSSVITGLCARAGGRLTPFYCDKLAHSN